MSNDKPPKSYLEYGLRNVPSTIPPEVANSIIFKIFFVTVVFIITWITISFLFTILFVLIPSIIGLKDIVLECNNVSIDTGITETTEVNCDTKDWVSFIVNLSSFIVTLFTLLSPPSDRFRG